MARTKSAPGASDAQARRELTRLANVGPATAGDLLLLGIRSQAQLRGRDAFELYDELCRRTGQRHDPCVIDTFLAIIDCADGGAERAWWHYTPLRKRLQAARAERASVGPARRAARGAPRR